MAPRKPASRAVPNYSGLVRVVEERGLRIKTPGPRDIERAEVIKSGLSRRLKSPAGSTVLGKATLN